MWNTKKSRIPPKKNATKNANKVIIGADLADGADKTTQTVVDTETGEIKDVQAQEQKPNPGF